MKTIPSACAPRTSAPSASSVIIVPFGLAGLAASTPLSGRSRWAAITASGARAKRVAAERGEHVAVGRVARARNGDPVARLEHGEERQQESGRGAGGHNDAAG